MRTIALAVTGLLLGLAGFTMAQSTTAPASSTATVLHIDVKGKDSKNAAKMSAGDTCTLTVKDAKDVYTGSVKDTTATPGVTSKGAIEETTLLATLNLKKLSKVTWTVAAGSTKDVIALTTTETLPTK